MSLDCHCRKILSFIPRLFLFEVDPHTSPASVKVENFYPIKGSFSSEVKSEALVKGVQCYNLLCIAVFHAGQCQVLLNNGVGSSLVLQLSYDSHTAVFISQLNKALHQFSELQFP